MRRRSDDASEELGLRAVYSIGALARVAGVNRFFLRRLLLRAGVVLLRSGRSCVVPVTEIERKIPPLWESILRVEAVRAKPEPAAPPPEDPPRGVRLVRLVRGPAKG